MASLFNARALVHPSRVLPENIITIAQPSGYATALAGAKIQTILSEIDKVVYQNRIFVTTTASANQGTHNALPSATVGGNYVQTATYMIRNRAEYNEFDVAEAGEWNVALPEAYRLAMRQGIFQTARAAALYGVNAANNEGLLNTPNSTAVTLPPDSYGDTTVSTYDAGELAIWINTQFLAALSRIYALGTSAKISVVGPQRIIGFMQMVGIVQLTSYQRPGGGTATTAQLITKILEENGIAIEWAYDDTLEGKGAGSADALLVTVPEAVTPTIAGQVNTNVFATLQPNASAMTMQLANVAAPVEVTTPIVEGVDVTSSMRITSGWAPRGQAVTILSMNP